jgi:hypothetical protein
MDTIAAARLTRLVEAVGSDLAPAGLARRRTGRLNRAQAAWLSGLSPRSLRAAERELVRRRGRLGR